MSDPLTRARLSELAVALDFHARAGRIVAWSMPDEKTWLVSVGGDRVVHCTLNEAEYLCVGLDSAARAHTDFLRPEKLARLMRGIRLPVQGIGENIEIDVDQLAAQILEAVRKGA
jgi:hypothetical protein